MNSLHIARLQRRYGMTETQARLFAELFFGEASHV